MVFKSIFGTLWLALRPFDTLQNVIGASGVIINLLVSLGAISGGGILGKIYFPNSNQTSEGDWFPFIVGIVSVFAIFVLVAGIKLQYKLYKTENEYHYALSLDNETGVNWIDKTLSIDLSFSNALNKPIGFQFIHDKTYIELDGIPRVFLKPSNRDIIRAKKTVIIQFPKTDVPNKFPCKGILHYELIYGLPEKALFKQVKEYDTEVIITQPPKEIRIALDSKIEEDNPIKKQIFVKIN